LNLLVTGASGFIGLNVVEALLARGDAVCALSNSPMPTAALRSFAQLPGRLEPIEGDVTKAEEVATLVAARRPQIVIHGAAVTPSPASEREKAAATLAVNILGTHHVLAAAAQAGVQRFILLSSASVYGDSAFGPDPLDEVETRPEPRTLYAISKFTAERMAARYRETTGLQTVSARLSAAFGPWEYATGLRNTLSPFWQTMRLAQGGCEAVLDRLCQRDWIYSRDAAQAILAVVAAADPVPPIVNIGPGRVTPFDLWLEILRERKAGFRWRIGRPEEANVDLQGERDRALLSDRLLTQWIGWSGCRTPKLAFDDYIGWEDTP
jgi:nucleoside-diphosphate-sugar epimerase